MPGNRTNTGKFAPGKSGNPNGRPKVDKQVQKALKAATLDAAQTLIELMNDEDQPGKVRLQAATTILDRVYGKPGQHVDVDGAPSISIALAGNVEQYLV